MSFAYFPSQSICVVRLRMFTFCLRLTADGTNITKVRGKSKVYISEILRVNSSSRTSFRLSKGRILKSRNNAKPLNPRKSVFHAQNYRRTIRSATAVGFLSVRLFELQEIMVSSKKQEKTSTFSIIFEYTFLLVILLFIFNVYLDFAYRGWEASMCRRAATYIGMQEKADAAFKAAQEEVFNIVTDVCKQYPELTKAVEPYYYLVRDLNAVFLNLMERSYAIAAAKVADLQGLVELYAPGFLEKTGKALNEIWATSVLYCERGVDYLKKDVFVGKLSPENIRKVIMDVFNASQQKAEEYYQLVYKKIQTIFM